MAGSYAIHERARAVVDRFAGECHVVGVHHAMDEADQLPAGDQGRLPSEDRVEQRDVRLRRIGELRVVSRPRVVRKRPHGFLVVVCRCPLHGADADMARGNARQHCAVEHRLAIDRLARLHHCQAPGGRNAERVHRLADDVFPQHRPERGAPVTPAGEPRLPCPFQLNVHAIAGWRDLLAKQDRTAIAEGREVAELVAGVRLRDGSPAFGHGIARENRGAFGTLERLRLESEHRRERPVESGQARLANRSRCRMRVEELRQLRVRAVKWPNWWPAYAWAIGRPPSGTAFPAKIAAPSGPSSASCLESKGGRERSVEGDQARLANRTSVSRASRRSAVAPCRCARDASQPYDHHSGASTRPAVAAPSMLRRDVPSN